METCSVVLTLESVDEMHWCDHLNETSLAIFCMAPFVFNILQKKIWNLSCRNFDPWHSWSQWVKNVRFPIKKIANRIHDVDSIAEIIERSSQSCLSCYIPQLYIRVVLYLYKLIFLSQSSKIVVLKKFTMYDVLYTYGGVETMFQLQLAD